MRNVQTQNRNPPTAVDIINEVYQEGRFEGIVLIQRANEPYKGRWALVGGFQEWGESLETTAIRESQEEINQLPELLAQLHIYSPPTRDPRGHVNSVGFIARIHGLPKAGDDAAHAAVFPLDKIPYPLAFDHDERIKEYLAWKQTH